MIKLDDKETTLLFTIRGDSPLGYSFVRDSHLNISNKLSYLYPNAKRFHEINHDMIRLAQKLEVNSSRLSQILLTLNYHSVWPGVSLEEELFRELYRMLQVFDIRDGFEFDRGGLMKDTPSVQEELEGLSIVEGLSFITLYYVGHKKREEGYRLLFDEYVKVGRDLTFEELNFISERFHSVYRGIDPKMFERAVNEDPVKEDDDSDEETFSCFRKPGECAHWGLPYIKVSYSYDPEDFDFRYIEETSGDDYTQGFWKKCESKEEVDRFVEGVVLPYLEECKEGLKDAPSFKEYFLSHGVGEEDLDFN